MWNLQTCWVCVSGCACVVHVYVCWRYVCLCMYVSVSWGPEALSQASYQMDVFDISAAKDFPHIHKQPLNRWQVALTEAHRWNSYMFRSSVSVLLCHPLSCSIFPLSYIKQHQPSWWKMASYSIFLSHWQQHWFIQHTTWRLNEGVCEQRCAAQLEEWRLHWCQAS